MQIHLVYIECWFKRNFYSSFYEAVFWQSNAERNMRQVVEAKKTATSGLSTFQINKNRHITCLKRDLI